MPQLEKDKLTHCKIDTWDYSLVFFFWSGGVTASALHY